MSDNNLTDEFNILYVQTIQLCFEVIKIHDEIQKKYTNRKMTILKKNLINMNDSANELKKYIHLNYLSIPAKQRLLITVPENKEVDELIDEIFKS